MFVSRLYFTSSKSTSVTPPSLPPLSGEPLAPGLGWGPALPAPPEEGPPPPALACAWALYKSWLAAWKVVFGFGVRLRRWRWPYCSFLRHFVSLVIVFFRAIYSPIVIFSTFFISPCLSNSILQKVVIPFV